MIGIPIGDPELSCRPPKAGDGEHLGYHGCRFQVRPPEGIRHASAEFQILFIPPPPAPPPAVIQVQAASPGVEWSGATATVTTDASTLEDGRGAGFRLADEAARGRGFSPGSGRIRAESFSGGRYFLIMDYAAPRGAGGSATTAQSASLPRWVLVVPVEGEGIRASWQQSSAWTRSWIAPTRQASMRLLGIAGDGDDKEKVGARTLGTNDEAEAAGGLGALARRHGAPAVAMVRLERTGVRVVAVRNGTARTEWVASASTLQATRDAAAQAIERLMAVQRQAPEASDPVPAGQEISATVSIAYFSPVGGGGVAEILCDTDNPAEHADLRRAVRSIPGLEIRTSRLTSEGLLVTVVWDGDRGSLGAALRQSGLYVERD